MRCPVPCAHCGEDVELSDCRWIDDKTGVCVECWEVREQPDFEESVVSVCAACFRASCWQGQFYCDNSRSADVVKLPVKELRRKGLESEHYWQEDLGTGPSDQDARAGAGPESPDGPRPTPS